jgi:hypothetical protein
MLFFIIIIVLIDYNISSIILLDHKIIEDKIPVILLYIDN